jgi:hypothetical protein
MEKSYILGSHNSWSFLPLKHWWMRPFAFMARCQSKSIVQQYHQYGVRCFDLRIRMNRRELNHPIICHGYAEYDISRAEIMEYLSMINGFGDCYVRVIQEVRTKKQYDETVWDMDFSNFCKEIEKKFPNIKFWCGRSLYGWVEEYVFQNNPSCEEKYSSVCKPDLIDDWWPWLFAKRNNKKILKQGTDKDILLIDFVNIR